jgi:signal transduction histidine kinase
MVSIIFVIVALLLLALNMRFVDLSDPAERLRIAARNSDDIFGTMLIGSDVLRLDRSIRLALNGDSKEAIQYLQTSNDLMFNRFTVVDLVIKRREVGRIGFPEDTLRNYRQVYEAYIKTDELIQDYLITRDIKNLQTASKLTSETIPIAVQLSSLMYQHSRYSSFKVREKTLKNLAEYQTALTIIAVLSLFFFGIILFQYFKVRRANFKIEETAKELHDINQAKTKFMSSVSHELRTPLNAIIGFAQILEMDIKSITPRKKVEYNGHILDSANILLELINQVLDLDMIESGKLVITEQTFGVASLINNCVEVSKPLADKFKVGLVCENIPDVSLHTDEARLRQIVLNFTSNGVKYNNPGGRVSISCESLNNGGLRIVIADTGIGIPDTKTYLLFKPFERLGREAHNIEGTGIGLNICRSIAAHLGMKVGYNPNVKGGSCFWVEIPPELVVVADT